MTLDMELGADLGVTDVSDFAVSLDGGSPIQIVGLTLTGTNPSTVDDLIDAINAQITGVTAELDASGEIRLTRNWYGSNTSIALSGDIANQVFDFGGTGLYGWPGLDSGGPWTSLRLKRRSRGHHDLQIEADDDTGLMTNITGLVTGA